MGRGVHRRGIYGRGRAVSSLKLALKRQVSLIVTFVTTEIVRHGRGTILFPEVLALRETCANSGAAAPSSRKDASNDVSPLPQIVFRGCLHRHQWIALLALGRGIENYCV